MKKLVSQSLDKIFKLGLGFYSIKWEADEMRGPSGVLLSMG